MNFKEITDEQLAQFIEGNATPAESDAILDAIQSFDDLETVVLATTASAMFDDDVSDDLPAWDISPKGRVVKLYPFEPLPACGFLGNEDENGKKE